MGDQIDIERVRSSREQTAPPKRPRTGLPRPRRAERFIKGPIPLSWVTTAAQLGGKCCQVGNALWYVAGLQRSGAVKLSYAILELFGVDRWTYYRALDALAAAKLVSVERACGKSPVVTLLQAPAPVGNDTPDDRE